MSFINAIELVQLVGGILFIAAFIINARAYWKYCTKSHPGMIVWNAKTIGIDSPDPQIWFSPHGYRLFTISRFIMRISLGLICGSIAVKTIHGLAIWI